MVRCRKSTNGRSIFAERYGDISEKTLDRWRKDGRVPQPDFYRGQVPYWDETQLDAADLKAIESREPLN